MPISRRQLLKSSVFGLLPAGWLEPAPAEIYMPPSELDGGWRVAEPSALSVDATTLAEAISYHDSAPFTQSFGGAIVVVYRGHVIGESYVTGGEGGPQPWTRRTCNSLASSTKSVFGTAAGVLLDEYRDRVDLDSYLVGESRDGSLIPQIWDQPISDERKKKIKVKHVLSMTSGHEGDEPWQPPSPHLHYSGYTGAFQMHEYCFGWWHFDDVPAHHTLKFDPGTDFTYSNYGMEQFGLAMRNLSGEMVGPYVYDRVLRHMGMPIGIRDNRYRAIPDPLNFSDEPGWAVGGSEGCDAYACDESESEYGYNSIVGATLRCSARDLARLGYLWLNKGRWGERQLVPRSWMELATKRHLRDDGSAPSPYGYTFWVHDDWEGVPSDTFASRGFNVNDCYVVPSLDLVVARLGNHNPPRGERTRFTKTILQKIVSAITSA